MAFEIKSVPHEPGAVCLSDEIAGEVGRFTHITVFSFERFMTAEGDLQVRVIAQDDATLRLADKIKEAVSCL